MGTYDYCDCHTHWCYYDFIQVFNISIDLFAKWVIAPFLKVMPKRKQRNTWVELTWHDP